jgi:hypothetical protein
MGKVIGEERAQKHKDGLLNSTKIKGAGVTTVPKLSEVNSMTSSGASLGLTPASVRIEAAKASRVDRNRNDFMVGESVWWSLGVEGLATEGPKSPIDVDYMLSKWPEGEKGEAELGRRGKMSEEEGSVFIYGS